MVSCNGDREVCDTLPKFKPINDMVSMYIKDNKIWGFVGEQTQEGVLDFLSADAWLEGEELCDDFSKFYEEITGQSKPIGEQFWKKYEEVNAAFTTRAEKLFNKAPYIDKWSSNAKVLMASVFIIPPIIFTVFYLFVFAQCHYHNYQVDKKYEKMN